MEIAAKRVPRQSEDLPYQHFLVFSSERAGDRGRPATMDSHKPRREQYLTRPRERGIDRVVEADVRPKTACGITYLLTNSTNPPEISVATLVRIIGNAKPPGEARYLGDQMGSNLSLYCRRP